MGRKKVAETEAGATVKEIRDRCERVQKDSGRASLDLELPFTGSGPTIKNIVCGVDLGCRIELRIFSQNARNVDYQPKRFPAAVVRLRDPKITGLLFASGKAQIMGAHTIADARFAARKFARMLTKTGNSKPNVTDFIVQNIVANADFEFPIRLEGIAIELHQWARYEPEIFPGLVLRLGQPKVTVLMFAKGKIVLLGAREVRDVDKALQAIWPIALTFRFDRIDHRKGAYTTT